jgi:hypothetical protein
MPICWSVARRLAKSRGSGNGTKVAALGIAAGLVGRIPERFFVGVPCNDLRTARRIRTDRIGAAGSVELKPLVYAIFREILRPR